MIKLGYGSYGMKELDPQALDFLDRYEVTLV